MKKQLFAVFLFSCIFGLFADNYKIVNIEYEIKPCSWKFLACTKEYALEQNVSVDKNRIFSSEEELLKYLSDYKQRLHNLRAFESIDINYNISDIEETSDSSDNLFYHAVELTTRVTDSIPLLAVPYGTYNSNSGTVFKLKAKDTNFLGSLNTMSCDFDFQLEQAKETEQVDYVIGANFEYDYPFKAGIFNATWINDYAISYTFGDELPEWDAKTGLKFVLPTNWLSYTFEFYQSIINNYDYEYHGDNFYYKETASFSVPIPLTEINNWGKITYTPYLDFVYNWDKDGISNLHYNYSLSGPELTPGHRVSSSRINWSDNLRTGLSSSLSNSFSYNFDRHLFSPYVGLDTQAYKRFNIYEGNWFSRFGICTNALIFGYFTDKNSIYLKYDGKYIGGRLRGIRDKQKYMVNDSRTNSDALNVLSAICFNFDLPFHIFSTNFNSKYLRYFNFDFQINPFMDLALTYNKITQKAFDPKDGFYAAGLEFLVYPKKWSSYTVRASVGYDVGRAFLSDYLNMEWRENVSKFEISFGLGLHY